MIASLWLPMLLPLTAGFLLAGLCEPGPHLARPHVFMKACLAIGIAFGVSSCLYFLWMMIAGPGRVGLIVGESTMLLAVAAFLYVRKRSPIRYDSACYDPMPKSVLAAIWLCALAALAAAVTRIVYLSLAAPHGEIDALTIWNLRARYLARGGEQWHDAFVALLAMHVPDYPLLLPATIARWWTYLGGEPAVVSALVGMLFTFATIGLAASALSLIRSRGQGLLAGIVLLGTPFLIKHGASQYADVPLAFFILATLTLFTLHDHAEGDRAGLLVLAGLMAGFAAWTKNEGLFFVPVVVLARLVVVAPARGWKACWDEMRMFAAGLLPILLVVIMFKTQVAPGLSLIVADQGSTTVERLADASRYVEAGQAFVGKAARFGHPGFVVLLIYLLLMGWRTDAIGRSGLRTAGLTLALMLAGYFMVIIVTPYGVRYQIDTSLDRLWLHLWPSIVFLFFLIVKTPEEALALCGIAPDESQRMNSDHEVVRA